jgi:hypothetical protein
VGGLRPAGRRSLGVVVGMSCARAVGLDVEVRLRVAGAHDHLTEPLDMKRFLEVVDGLLGSG